MQKDWNMNGTIGWSSMALGEATGLVMGMWSFAGPVTVPVRRATLFPVYHTTTWQQLIAGSNEAKGSSGILKQKEGDQAGGLCYGYHGCNFITCFPGRMWMLIGSAQVILKLEVASAVSKITKGAECRYRIRRPDNPLPTPTCRLIQVHSLIFNWDDVPAVARLT